MLTINSPHYFSHFIVDVPSSGWDQDKLCEIVQQAFSRFFVVKSCRLIDSRIEDKLWGI